MLFFFHIANQSIEEERENTYEERRVNRGRLRVIQTEEEREETRETARLAMSNHRARRTSLEGPRTAHSALKLPLNLQHYEQATCQI